MPTPASVQAAFVATQHYAVGEAAVTKKAHCGEGGFPFMAALAARLCVSRRDKTAIRPATVVCKALRPAAATEKISTYRKPSPTISNITSYHGHTRNNKRQSKSPHVSGETINF